MTIKETLEALKDLGNETTRKHNLKFGAGENQFGVKHGDIRAIAKKIKTNHELALSLWDTGNVDAQLLAVLLMEPGKISAKEIENFEKSISFVHVADWFNSYVLKEFRDKEKLREKWMDSRDRWIARAGWSLTSGRVAREPEGLDLPALLGRIEKEMAGALPEVQWTMNSTLANIGIHFPALRKQAIAIGEKLGIFRDYPVSRGCTSPFAPIWINAVAK